MEVGLVHKIDVNEEMQQAYLDYAMSVIVARALPDARDGLKPVHRRILYAMYDMGIRPDTPYKKSARIVGEVLGKYHPHGDMAVYDSMARMAQDFSLRYLLVDGQGNFGSVDGDPPAAMRYTEARLALPAMHMLTDIGKNTVDFSDNFDGTLTEPTVLPSALPNLLVNGATGIAVGMATSIPPHNLGEVVDAMQYMLQNWEKLDEVGVEDLMHFVQGPDFPTGGVVVHEESGDGLVSAYSTGRGRVTVQARAHLEEMERGRNRVIVTELPYMTNKSSLIERIADLAREEKLEGIVDLRDESDRQGMRIVIELSKSADPEAVLRDLYKHTPMQSTFSIIMLALVDGTPHLLSLKQAIRVYLEHRLEIVRRRAEYDLEKARQRAHILEGLRVALKNLDEVIGLIRKAPDADIARTKLMKRFRLSDLQAQAILDMQLRRLAALERKKIEEEYKELLLQIKELEALLRSPKKMRLAVGQELAAVKEAYGDRRRTHIVQIKEGEQKAALITSAEYMPEKTIWLSVTADGLISRSLEDKLPRLSGKDAPLWLVQANVRDTLYLVGENGEAAALPVHAIPENDTPSMGAPLSKVSVMREEDRLAALFTLPAHSGREAPVAGVDDRYVLSVTRQGMVKKSALSELPGPTANLFTLARVNEGDRLGWLKISNGQNEVLLVTAQGMAIRFNEEEVRPMGLVAAGVMGIKLGAGDEIAGVDLLPQPGEVFMVASDGSAKRIKVEQFPRQGRYGQGVSAWKLPAKVQVTGMVVGKGVAHATLHMVKLMPKDIRLDEAPLQTRMARGRFIQEVKAGDQVTRLTLPWESSVSEPKIEKVTGRAPKTRSRVADQATPAEKVVRPTRKPAMVEEAPRKAAAPRGRKPGTAKIALEKEVTQPATVEEAPRKTATPRARKPAMAKEVQGKTTVLKTMKAAAATATPAREMAQKPIQAKKIPAKGITQAAKKPAIPKETQAKKTAQTAKELAILQKTLAKEAPKAARVKEKPVRPAIQTLRKPGEGKKAPADKIPALVRKRAAALEAEATKMAPANKAAQNAKKAAKKTRKRTATKKKASTQARQLPLIEDSTKTAAPKRRKKSTS